MNYKVPYNFILSFFYPLRPIIRKMLGCYALLLDQKIVMLLRDREDHPEFNGVFVATQPQFFEELSNELHSSNMEFDIDGVPHTWIFISEDLNDFEEKLKKAANMIRSGDKRIGKRY
jgi:hypothetical protein